MKRKEIEIVLPNGIEDLRIRHRKVFENPLYQNMESDLELFVDFVSDFYGIPRGKVLQIHYEDIKIMGQCAAKSLSQYKPKDPPKEVTINGIEYYLIDPSKVGIGWHMDYGAKDLSKDPVRAACLFYHPKGYTYGDMDDNKNLLKPIRSRYADFEQHFPLALYLDVSAFFLLNYQRSIATSILLLKAERLKRRIQGLYLFRGKKQSTT